MMNRWRHHGRDAHRCSRLPSPGPSGSIDDAAEQAPMVIWMLEELTTTRIASWYVDPTLVRMVKRGWLRARAKRSRCVYVTPSGHAGPQTSTRRTASFWKLAVIVVLRQSGAAGSHCRPASEGAEIFLAAFQLSHASMHTLSKMNQITNFDGLRLHTASDTPDVRGGQR